jgi:hypothetical protein
MRILSLDLSTHTGWCVIEEDGSIPNYGLINIKVKDYKAEIKTWKDYPPSYPINFINAADEMAMKVMELYHKFKPDYVVYEEINIARQRLSNKLLDFIHYAVIKALLPFLHPSALTSKCWRDLTGCYATKEDKKLNSKISKLKSKRKKDLVEANVGEQLLINESKKAIKIDGKVVGRVTKKHMSVRLVNELLGTSFKLNDNDITDAILLGMAFRKTLPQLSTTIVSS